MSNIQEFNFRYRTKRDEFDQFFSQFEENDPIETEVDLEESDLEKRRLADQTKQMDPNRTVKISQSMKDVVEFLRVNRPTDKDEKKQKGIRGFVERLHYVIGYNTHFTTKEWEGLQEVYRVELKKRNLSP